jgi:hypothetical protein
LHAGGDDGKSEDIAIRTTLPADEQGRDLKPPFGGPQHVLRHLAGYTHRVAISNHRLVSFQHDQVTFRYKDYAHGNKKRMMTLSSQEFLRRFLLHVLPGGFVRIRFRGFLANRCRASYYLSVNSYCCIIPSRTHIQGTSPQPLPSLTSAAPTALPRCSS